MITVHSQSPPLNIEQPTLFRRIAMNYREEANMKNAQTISNLKTVRGLFEKHEYTDITVIDKTLFRVPLTQYAMFQIWGKTESCTIDVRLDKDCFMEVLVYFGENFEHLKINSLEELEQIMKKRR